MLGTILIVDDEAPARHFYAKTLKDEGYDVAEAGTAKEALDTLSERNVDLVVLDLMLPDRSGLDILPEMLSQDPDLPVIFLSRYGNVQQAVQAMKLRACDFIPKPPDLPAFKRTIAHLVNNVQLQREVKRLRTNPKDGGQPFVLGSTRKMARISEMVDRVAPTNASVLITGESGSGKERIANLLHLKSNRANRPFMAINCAAIPENLIESELFGVGKGAFTNSVVRAGLIEQADGGTFFLDEIGAMKPDMQSKLLRVLETKVVRRVAGLTDKTVDVRFLSATNRDLKAAIANGEFREDLYYRLAVFTIDLPPLHERQSDIAALVAAYIAHFNKETGRNIEGVTPEALACLQAYRWPGNIRELRNIIERAVILCDGTQIGIEDFPAEIAHLSLQTTEPKMSLDQSLIFGDTLFEIERRLIREAVERAQGDEEQAAASLGISATELRARLSKG